MKSFLIVLVLLAFQAGCSSTAGDEYTDSLTIGTGLGHGTVTGAGDTFAIPQGSDGILLHFALESKYDIGRGYAISLLVQEFVDGRYIDRTWIDYEPLDEIDVHYLIESFYHDQGTGKFRATFIAGIRAVASRDYTITN